MKKKNSCLQHFHFKKPSNSFNIVDLTRWNSSAELFVQQFYDMNFRFLAFESWKNCHFEWNKLYFNSNHQIHQNIYSLHRLLRVVYDGMKLRKMCDKTYLHKCWKIVVKNLKEMGKKRGSKWNSGIKSGLLF